MRCQANRFPKAAQSKGRAPIRHHGDDFRLIIHGNLLGMGRQGNYAQQEDDKASFHLLAPDVVKFAKYSDTALISLSVRLRAMCPIKSLGSFLRVPNCHARSCEDRYCADGPTSGGKDLPTPTPLGPWQTTHSGILRSQAPRRVSTPLCIDSRKICCGKEC